MTETAIFLGIESSVKRVWNLNAQKTLTQKNQHDVYSSFSIRCVKN